jgi:hypothetical protein
MQLKRTEDFIQGARVPVPVNYKCSGNKICLFELTVNEWCWIAKVANGFKWWLVHLDHEDIEIMKWRLYNAVARIKHLQKAVANALLRQKALTIPSFTIKLAGASAEGIAIILTMFSEKILDVDLGWTRPPNKNRRISRIKLPNIEERIVRLEGWLLTDCFWMCLGGPPKSNQWILSLSLKRHSNLVKPAVVTVELRSMGCDVIGEPGPVEPYVFERFSKEVMKLFEICEFGVFDFNRYRHSGQVGRGFALRIKIVESHDEPDDHTLHIKKELCPVGFGLGLRLGLP